MFQSVFQNTKPAYNSKLNLVALMDIFTILVFFLLLNSGDAEKLESAKFVELPNSQAGTPPHTDLVVMIGRDAIWLGEQRLIGIEELADEESSISVLSDALNDYRERKGELNSYEEENGLSLTIMGDHAVSYGLLKTVMATCRLADFRDIALAVNQVVAPASSGAEASPALADRNFPSKQGER